MKRTLIAAATAVAAGLAAAYLTGADGTAAAHQTGTTGSSGTPTPMTSVQQVMQAPALETEECAEGYILPVPCPVCHTCPVCQANCGTAHLLKCCLGNAKQASRASGQTAGGTTSGTPQQQHIMTNKAEAVKHAAGHPADAPQAQADSAVISVLSIESD